MHNTAYTYSAPDRGKQDGSGPAGLRKGWLRPRPFQKQKRRKADPEERGDTAPALTEAVTEAEVVRKNVRPVPGKGTEYILKEAAVTAGIVAATSGRWRDLTRPFAGRNGAEYLLKEETATVCRLTERAPRAEEGETTNKSTRNQDTE